MLTNHDKSPSRGDAADARFGVYSRERHAWPPRSCRASWGRGLIAPDDSLPFSGGGEDGNRGERVTNALDYYGTWKLFDGLADAVFRGVHREYALGNTSQQRHMGEWSDRMPVRELMIGLP